MLKVKITKKTRICQGDIFKEIDFIEYIIEKKGNIEISKITFPYVIVLTQDCELQQDYRHRKKMWETEKRSRAHENKMLLSVLVAPLYNSEHVFLGDHLSELDNPKAIPNRSDHKMSREEKRKLTNNETPRYHHLVFPAEIPISPSIIDFKHYFSVNVEYLRKLKSKNFICKVSELYREDILLRFANYLSRIGLPDNDIMDSNTLTQLGTRDA